MSVRVNLLPAEAAERNAAVRSRAVAGAAALGLIALLGGAYIYQAGRVASARDQLATEQAEVDRLQAEVGELSEFALLRSQTQEADALFTANFGGEISFAGLLQDLATVFPTDAELESLTVVLADEPDAVLGAERLALGRMTASGATLRGHAPGLERLLLELDKVASFSNVFFSTSTQEGDVSRFTLDVDLGDEILTMRYADGLPEGLR